MQRLVELESDVSYRVPAISGEEEYRYAGGFKPVLITAPHGAAHLRNGRLKEEDEYTAAISLYVGEITGAHVLYQRRKSFTDANYDPHVPFKKSLAALVRREGIRFVLDLHGASDGHHFGIALGTMRGRSCPDEIALILSVLAENGFKPEARWPFHLDVDESFTGAGGPRQETITRFVKETLGVPAIQVELASCVRVVELHPDGRGPHTQRGSPVLIARTVKALADIVNRL